jgi:predicted Zn-dependent protease
VDISHPKLSPQERCVMSSILLLLSMVFSSSVPQGSYAITGSIRTTDGRGVDSIRVSLMDENYQIIKTVFTDSTGRYRFSAVRTGSYIVSVVPIGGPYEETSQQLDLQTLSGGRRGKSGSTTEPVLVDFVLKRKKGVVENRVNEVVFAQDIPEAARAEYKHGLDKLKENMPEEGISALKRAVKIFPDYYLALELLGTEYVKRGELQAALPVLTHALEVNQRTAAKSLYGLGVAYLKLKRAAEAIPLLVKAAEQDGGNANVHMMLGLAYGYNNLLKEAEESFKKAYHLGGNQAVDAYLYLAGIYNKQGRYADAVQALEVYLKETDEKNTDKGKVRELIARLKVKQKVNK